MKKDDSYLKFFIVIISMAALNVFLEVHFPGKTFTSATILICGLITLILLSCYGQAVERQYERAQLILDRRYRLIKLVDRNGDEPTYGINGALLSYFDETSVKHVYFFKDVKFSSEVDFNNLNDKLPGESFICVCEKGELVLKPKNCHEN